MTTQQIVQEQMFTAAYHEYKDALNRYAFWKLRDQAMSQDLVQNTFMKAWNYFVKGGTVYSIKSFLYHILNNLIIDEYRKHKTESLDRLVEKREIEELQTNPSDHFMDVFDARVTNLLLTKLPEKFQKIVRMKYLKELSLNEISSLTGQSKNAIAVQAHRGLKKLKSLYRESY